MPNWIYHRATLRPFTRDGQRIIERLLAAKNTHNWFGNAAPTELQILEDSLPLKDGMDKETWFAKNATFPNSPYEVTTNEDGTKRNEYSNAFIDHLSQQFAFKPDWWSPLTFGVKWGACNESFSAIKDGLRYNCRTPYDVCQQLYIYLTRNGIDVDVVCDGEMDGKYIFKSRGGQYTAHYTASGDLRY
jgi:hypothetical protein